MGQLVQVVGRAWGSLQIQGTYQGSRTTSMCILVGKSTQTVPPTLQDLKVATETRVQIQHGLEEPSSCCPSPSRQSLHQVPYLTAEPGLQLVPKETGYMVLRWHEGPTS